MALNQFVKIVGDMAAMMVSIKERPEQVESAIKECGIWLRKMNTALKEGKSVGEKQRLAACIGHIQGFRIRMKMMRVVTGTGYKPPRPNRSRYASTRVKWVDQRSAFKNRIRTGLIVNLTHKDLASFLSDAQQLFRRRIINVLKRDGILKVNAVFCGEFVINKGDKCVHELKYMNTANFPIYCDTNLHEWFDCNIVNAIKNQLEEFQERDSGWALSAIINLTLNINKFLPQLGSSFFKLPLPLRRKNACINVRNNDEACFAWAITSALHPVKINTDRINSYPHYSGVLNMKNITMPMTIKQIPLFERQNDISINVYTWEKSAKVLPTYLTSNKKERHVNLLLLQDIYEDDKQTYQFRYHYVWIKNLSKLISSQLNKHNGRKYFCDRCLHYFHSQVKLDAHVQDCIDMNNCRVRLPFLGQTVQFKNYHYKEKVPFVIYADIECLLKPTNSQNKLQNHIPYSIGYYVNCSYDNTLSFYQSYRGEDCQQWFANELKQFSEDVETVFLCPISIEPLTPEQELAFNNISNCHICEKCFEIYDIKVRDHCHLTGKYRGPAHENCNLNYQDSRVIPVIFHNLSGYDSHFIIENLAKDFAGQVDLLPITKEKYISFTKHINNNLVKFRFIDSYRFLSSSLGELSSYLELFPILKHENQHLDESLFNLLKRKGVFPYDYIDCFEKLNVDALPDRSNFFNSLTDSHITNEDYIYANMVYKSFNCQNLGEYADLYLKTDILLLADVFEQFRQSCLQTYNLDPAHYYTLPGYTWDAMLKLTQINLELLSDIDMVMYIERGIRGGLSQCSKRYAKANNKYLANFNPSEPSKYLVYFDINNQYGWAMSQHLPYGGFEWVDPEHFNFHVPDSHPEGYILEVDLEYPQDMHNQHRDLPFCPEHRSVPKSRGSKLMATVYHKERYVIHYRNLIQALENGLILKKIHRVLKFKQSPSLKSYIDLNTKLRKGAKNEFEKNLFKLMNNAVFGKTMENIRKHCIVKLVTKWEGRYGAEALISKPQFKSSTIFDENLVAIELNKSEVYFNKPIYVGMCVLDISKLKIYNFHYLYMKSRFDDKAVICYTDTDSLIYEVTTADLYEVIRQDAMQYFDTSDYPNNNIYNIPRVNKKVLGIMKDESNGKIVTEFVGHRSKSYATRVEGNDKDKKAKGVMKHIVKNRITFEDYFNCLKDGKEISVQQRLIRSDKHNVSTIEQTKIALSPYDDKRYLIPGSYETLPWGHHSIMDVEC